jgi:hypothetical protein
MQGSSLAQVQVLTRGVLQERVCMRQGRRQPHDKLVVHCIAGKQSGAVTAPAAWGPRRQEHGKRSERLQHRLLTGVFPRLAYNRSSVHVKCEVQVQQGVPGQPLLWVMLLLLLLG